MVFLEVRGDHPEKESIRGEDVILQRSNMQVWTE